ncbi:MAG: hypothetical protein ACOYOB_12640 [Myxococcota bacterium]
MSIRTLLLLLAALPLVLVGCGRKAEPGATEVPTQAVAQENAPAGAAGVVPDLPPGANPAMPPSHPAMGGTMPEGGHPALPADKPIDVGAVAKADHTVAEVRTNKATLGGQTFEVRGRVIKVNRGIMGKNWIHVVDGTEGKLVVTSVTGSAERGDLVKVKGKLGVDRDMGAGYLYDVLLEDAEVTVEQAAAAAPPAGPAAAPAAVPAPAAAPAPAPAPAPAAK